MATGKAKKVIDGDTFQLASGKRIRPEGYNAPEKREKGSQKATQQLKRLIQGKTVGLSLFWLLTVVVRFVVSLLMVNRLKC